MGNLFIVLGLWRDITLHAALGTLLAVLWLHIRNTTAEEQSVFRLRTSVILFLFAWAWCALAAGAVTVEFQYDRLPLSWQNHMQNAAMVLTLPLTLAVLSAAAFAGMWALRRMTRMPKPICYLTVWLVSVIPLLTLVLMVVFQRDLLWTIFINPHPPR